MSLYKNCGWWKNSDCIFEFSVKSYVTNTINLSCAKILLPSVINAEEVWLIPPFQLASRSKAYISYSAKTRIVGSNPTSLPPTRMYLRLSSVWTTLAYSVVEQHVRGHIMTTFMAHSVIHNQMIGTITTLIVLLTLLTLIVFFFQCHHVFLWTFVVSLLVVAIV